MPGLIGFTRQTASNKASLADLSRMAEMTLHDSFYRLDEPFADENICVTRSHVDVTQTDAQPHKHGEILVWLDGELYKQNKVISQYNLDPQGSDLALLATLYSETQNLNFLRHIEGIFVGCLYDRAQQKLYLFGNRFGLRRLYWTKHQNSLVWTGELKSLLALPGYQPKIDRAIEVYFLQNTINNLIT